MNRRLLIVVAVALLLLAALLTRGFGLFGGKGDANLTLYGNVDVREVAMAFRVPGRIADIAVEEGQRVRRGQPLAILDTASLDARDGEAAARVAQARAEYAKLQNGSRSQDVGQARARVAAAEAGLAAAAQAYDRRQPLLAPGAISREVWTQTVAERDRATAALAEARQALSLTQAGARAEDVAAARAALAAAEASAKSVTTDRGDARLLAAVAGTVVTRAREPGAIVAAGETVLTLSIDRPLRVRAYVAEPQLARISPGMAVVVTADGNARRYHGTIGFISPKAEFTPKTVETQDLRTDLVYRLRIIVTDPDDALRQGQPVTVAVPDARPAAD
ncbi:HlyD family efflux transporter periplasmic adaptor subunit [Sphingobium sufflavum]|uniref:HlyD family efflux transporter periplasmic adaptor subunit n=1 Tax=Sphingobium sufflavum TaxID=1129547 RepID=UPI001F254F2A|nr:HlyD family efflux transporter periplasmic adaptor subunit [Sphingobium sufflavum]MCE7795656.1 HlyD family efflux transporter periplasmic adaptor subunit [Sphingobium sufflavum]